MLDKKFKGILPIAVALMSAAVVFATSQSAYAEYPTKSITLVVPASAGGGQDTQARALASIIRGDLGKPIQVVNKPGGGHFIGAKFVADSKADGYTIMSDNLGTLILRSLAKKQAVDPLEDFEIVAMIGELYTALIVQQDDKRFSTTTQFIDYAKQHPEMTYGFSGKGGFHHIAGLGVANALGYSGRAIPFKGGSKVRAAMLGGQIDYAWIGIQQIKGYEDKLKVLAVASETRYPAMPDHPTFKEQGLPYTLVTGPSVVMAPKGTPKEVIATLGAAIEKGVNSAKYASMIKKKGLVPVYRNAADAKAYLLGLADKWKPLVALR
jgi:tripartite-type tricarboxylate transporter receptor subunit TctC